MGVEVFGAIALNAMVVVAAIALSFWIGRAGGPVVLSVFVVSNVLLPAAVLVGAFWGFPG